MFVFIESPSPLYTTTKGCQNDYILNLTNWLRMYVRICILNITLRPNKNRGAESIFNFGTVFVNMKPLIIFLVSANLRALPGCGGVRGQHSGRLIAFQNAGVNN